MLFDYHMHSDFSEDCFTPMEDTIESAIQKGLTEICFTEHLDYDYPDPDFTFGIDIDTYNTKMKAMQNKYKNKLSIKKGIEVGVQPHVLEKTSQFVREGDFDFVICSMHAADKKDLHNGDFFKGRTPSEAYQYFYEELLYCVQHYDDYNVLGHLDLVKRYKSLDTDERFHEVIREIFKIIIPKGKGIEVNASGYGYGLGTAMPSIDILQLYKDCGGEIITVGSDAHIAEHVAYRFPEILHQLNEIGFPYIASFTKQQPSFHPIHQFL